MQGGLYGAQTPKLSADPISHIKPIDNQSWLLNFHDLCVFQAAASSTAKEESIMTLTTEKIWADFHDQLYGFILKRVNDKQIASDLLQEVFIKIHIKLDTLKNHDKLTSWIYQVTRNSILDYFKTKKITASLPVDLAENPDPITFNKEMEGCLKTMLNELPAEYKDPLMQTELGTLSQKEYAEKAGISYSGAKSRVQRARQALNELFQSCCRASFDKYGNVIEHVCMNKNCNCDKEHASF